MHNMRIGAQLRIASFDVLSQCEKCKKYIWVMDLPDNTGSESICVICALKEVGIMAAVNKDDVSAMLLDGLNSMHEAGY